MKKTKPKKNNRNSFDRERFQTVPYHYLFWGFVVVFSLAAFGHLANRPLWLDEGGSYYYISRGSLQAMFDILYNDSGLPLYYTILYFWCQLFGYSEMALRLPSFIFYGPSIVVIYFFANRLFPSKNIARLSVVLLTISPFVVNLAANARMYSLLMLLTLLSWYLFYLLYLKGEKPEKYSFQNILFIIVNVLSLYTHYWGFFHLAAQGLCYLILRRDIIIARDYSVSLLLFTPVLKTVIFQSTRFSDIMGWVPEMSVMQIARAIAYFFLLDYDYALYVFVVFAVLFLVFRAKIVEAYKNTPAQLHFLLFGFVGPITVGILVSLFKPIFQIERYQVGAFPPFAILLAYLVDYLNRVFKKTIYFTGALVIIFSISCYGIFYSLSEKYNPLQSKNSVKQFEDQKAAAAIKESVKPGGNIVFVGLSSCVLAYYLRDSDYKFIYFPDDQKNHPAWYPWYNMNYYTDKLDHLKKNAADIVDSNFDEIMVVTQFGDPVGGILLNQILTKYKLKQRYTITGSGYSLQFLFEKK